MPTDPKTIEPTLPTKPQEAVTKDMPKANVITAEDLKRATGKSSVKSNKIPLPSINFRTGELRRIFLSTPERKSYTMLGLTLGMLVIVILFVVNPTLSTIRQRFSEIEGLTNDLAFLNERFNTISSLGTEYNSSGSKSGLRVDMETIAKYYPRNRNSDNLMQLLIDETNSSGLSFVAISISQSEDSQAYIFNTETEAEPSLVEGTVVLSVSSSDIDKILSFIETLERYPMYPIIQGVSFTSDQENGKYSIAISFNIYYMNYEN